MTSPPHLRVRLIRIRILQVNPEREVKFLQCDRALVRVRRLPREEIIEKSRIEFEVDLVDRI